MKPGPWLCLLGGDGDKAFSYSEIRLKEGFGRLPLSSFRFSRGSGLLGRVSLGRRVVGEPPGAARPSGGETDSPAAGRLSVGKPYWETLTRSEVIGKVEDAVEASVGSGCIKSRGEKRRLEGRLGQLLSGQSRIDQ